MHNIGTKLCKVLAARTEPGPAIGFPNRDHVFGHWTRSGCPCPYKSRHTFMFNRIVAELPCLAIVSPDHHAQTATNLFILKLMHLPKMSRLCFQV
jgi:hypothetical protein